MKLLPDSTSETEPYVRADISLGVLIALLSGIVFAISYHWTILTITIALSYMAIGVSTVYEWNKILQEDGRVPQGVFGNVRTAAFLPALVLLVSFHYQGFPFLLSGTVSLVLLVMYLYTLYSVGFRGIKAEQVHFEDDPYTGQPCVWDEETYIPLLEKWSVEQAQE